MFKKNEFNTFQQNFAIIWETSQNCLDAPIDNKKKKEKKVVHVW